MVSAQIRTNIGESMIQQKDLNANIADDQIYPQLTSINAFNEEANKIKEYLENFKKLDKSDIYKNASVDDDQVEIYMLFSQYYTRMDAGKKEETK